MPRQKTSAEIETLERQQRELKSKLKDAKAKARSIDRETRNARAKVAGSVFLDELDKNPSGKGALALLALLDAKLTRRADREAFGLSIPTTTKDEPPAPAKRAKDSVSEAVTAAGE